MLPFCCVVAKERQGGIGKSAGAGTRGSRQSTVETHGQARGRETVWNYLLFYV